MLALALFAPLGIGAIIVGNGALREDPGDSRARAGVVLGWIALALLAVGLCLFSVLMLMLFSHPSL